MALPPGDGVSFSFFFFFGGGGGEFGSQAWGFGLKQGGESLFRDFRAWASIGV